MCASKIKINTHNFVPDTHHSPTNKKRKPLPQLGVDIFDIGKPQKGSKKKMGYDF